MYTVIYQVLKVWTQHHFVLLPRHWFSSTKSGQPLIKLYICWTHWLSTGIIMMMRRRIKIIRDLVWFPVWGTSNSEGKKELKQARLINKKACLQGSKKPEFKLVLWGSSCHILLARGHFLLISVDGLCPLDKKALKVICPVRKSTRSRLPNGTFFEPCYTTVHSVHPWTVNC